MSYVGSFKCIMAESGLREAIETVYAPKSVDHILSGKAISRAIRSHTLVDAALNGLLLSETLS